MPIHCFYLQQLQTLFLSFVVFRSTVFFLLNHVIHCNLRRCQKDLPSRLSPCNLRKFYACSLIYNISLAWCYPHYDICVASFKCSCLYKYWYECIIVVTKINDFNYKSVWLVLLIVLQHGCTTDLSVEIWSIWQWWWWYTYRANLVICDWSTSILEGSLYVHLYYSVRMDCHRVESK